jgi:phage/plasmid-like protein (TIGR03299 family)
MAANVESMMYFGQRPWHGLGKELANPATAEDAIIYAGLDWQVTKEPIYFENLEKVEGHYATVRANSDLPNSKITLGVVKERYTPLQNKDAFGFFDAIVGEGKAIYHTAGVLGKGERIWILAKLPGEIRVAGDDISEKFLLLTNSHDGSSGVQVKFTPIRVCCQNTLNAALNHGDTINLKHTQNIDQKIKQAYQLLNITNAYYDQLEERFQAMAQKQVNSAMLGEYLKKVMPDAKNQTYSPIINLFENGQGNNDPLTRRTLWTAYNAVVEYVDHKRTRVKEQNKLQSIWFGGGAQIKQKAFDEALDLLKAA